MRRSRTVEPHNSALLEALLLGSRRDAYVMEANSYLLPAIGLASELQAACETLLQQIQALFEGRETFALLVMDSHREEIDGVPAERSVAACFGSRPPMTIVRPQTKGRHDEVPERIDLTAPDLTASIFKFAKAVCSGRPEPPEPSSSLCILAPYLVHRVESPPPRGYANQLKRWAVERDSFMLSAPVVYSETVNRMRDFGDYYFAAVLLVYLPSDVTVSASCLSWLELIWITFQMAWGFPTLGKQKDEIEDRKKQIEEQRTRLAEEKLIHDLALEVTQKVEGHVSNIRRDLGELVKELKPFVEGAFDHPIFHRVFEPTQELEPLWYGKGCTIYPRHEYDDLCPGRSNKDAILHYGILEILKRPPDAHSLNEQELAHVAEELVRQHAPAPTENTSRIAFYNILECLLNRGGTTSPAFAFDLLKSLTMVGREGRTVPYFAFAARLLIGQVQDDFKVSILPDPKVQSGYELNHNNIASEQSLMQVVGDGELYTTPSFVVGPTEAKRFAEMLRLLVRLIGYQLQLRGVRRNRCYVQRVEVVRHDEYTLVKCPIFSAEAERITNLFGKLSTITRETSPATLGGHDTQTTWLRLLQFHEFLEPRLDNQAHAVEFKLRR